MNEIRQYNGITVQKEYEIYQKYENFIVYNVYLVKNKGTNNESREFIYRETKSKKKATRVPSLREVLKGVLQK